MDLFDVYPIYPIEPVKGKGSYIWDHTGAKYLDLYGGHAVISVGHGHPHYVERIATQLNKIGFYSNSVQNSLQNELAEKLGQVSGYEEYSLFLCNSGAEANENALKLASFHTGKEAVITFKGGFHGRTSGAVAVSSNKRITSPFNAQHKVIECELNDIEEVEWALSSGNVCAVIIEGIQGLAGIYEPEVKFMVDLALLCKKYEVLLIADEVQSGYGRTSKFFAHQHHNIQPDIITVAKGMGNGFPIGGVLISPDIQPWYGMLGSTFGGNHLACAAALAVLEIIEGEALMANAAKMGVYLKEALEPINGIRAIRGKGLLMGLELSEKAKRVRGVLLNEHRILTGAAAQENTIRILPPLSIAKEDIDALQIALEDVIGKMHLEPNQA